MKSIQTLISDIYSRLQSQTPFEETVVSDFSQNLSQKLAARLSDPGGKPGLRMSNLGWPDRKLWYYVNKAELAEPISGQVRLKFLLGDIFEEVILFLAKASGHTVEQEQKEVTLYGVKGHIDAVIDGELVDAKSASSYGFRKFKDHGLERDDSFGYLSQLDGYRAAVAGDPAVVRSDRAHFLAGDKASAELCLDTHPARDVNYEAVIAAKQTMLQQPSPPGRCYDDKPFQESGNRKLGIECSYCPFKVTCWPGVRAFAYAGKPVFLTKVQREPSQNVKEIPVEGAWDS